MKATGKSKGVTVSHSTHGTTFALLSLHVHIALVQHESYYYAPLLPSSKICWTLNNAAVRPDRPSVSAMPIGHKRCILRKWFYRPRTLVGNLRPHTRSRKHQSAWLYDHSKWPKGLDLAKFTSSISTVWVKKLAPLKLFCNIFTWAKYISVKFCTFVASIYPHMLTSFGQFNLIFNKMALIFLGVLIAFTVSSFEFHQVRLPRLHR